MVIGSNTTKYYYDGDNIINETLNGSSYATNVLGVDGYISRKQNGTTGYLFKNAHGDVVSAYSSTTNKLADYTYDAWGEQQTTGTQVWGMLNPIRYNGQYYDTESGMTYLRARYYDSSARRFITEDPIRDGVNWYSYCGNNPVMFVDPSGLWGGELHYNMTQWIFEEFGLNSYHANIVAQANKNTDSDWATSPFNPISAGRHFDRDTNPYIDSRMSYADACYADAVNMWNRADALYNNGDINEEERHNMRVQSLESLGKGLHSLQDIDAHLDYNEGDVPYTPHHTGGIIDFNISVFDDPQYNIYKDDHGIYYYVDTNSKYGSDRYSNSVNKSRNYIYNFYVETGQR